MSRLVAYRPGSRNPWDERRAAHLARRAGFGAYGEELDELVRMGFDDAVEHFLDVPDEDPELDHAIAAVGNDLDVLNAPVSTHYLDDVERLKKWWVFRMVATRYPLREKLGLLWHDHFATQSSIVLRAPVLMKHVELLLAKGTGSFRELLHGVAADPCMLVFLDNRVNDARSPNENWGRELVELFTLGVDRYTQSDVRELARVFTGWTTPAAHEPEFLFDPAMHDTADKEVFGETIVGRGGMAGFEEGREALDAILARRDCAAWIARKLVTWFGAHEAPDRVVQDVAAELYETDYSIAAAVRALFRSEWFYAPEQEFALVRTPIELAVGVSRALGVQNPHLAGIVAKARRMGMNLLDPPSVAGWDHGESWIDSGSMVQRLNFAIEMSELPHTRREVRGRTAADFDAVVGELAEDAGHAELVRAAARRLLQRPLDAERESVLVAYLDGLDEELDAGLAPSKRRREKTRALVHLLLGTPEVAFA